MEHLIQKHNELKEHTLKFVELLLNGDFQENNIDKEISFIGIGFNDIDFKFHEVMNELINTHKNLKTLVLTDHICIVYGEICIQSNSHILTDEYLKLTMVVEETSEGMKLKHTHFSYPTEKIISNDTQKLKHSLDLYTQQLNILNSNIPGGVHQCENDSYFTLVSVSDGFLSMFGYTREEIEKQFHNHFIEMVYPDDRERLITTIQSQLKNGEDIEIEYRIICKDQKPVWVLDKGRFLKDGDGDKHFYCILVDISKRIIEQEKLRLALEQYRVIMDQATDIIFEWDIQKDILNFSNNWYKKFGYQAISTEISQRIPFSHNIHADDMPAFIKIMKDTADGVPYSETEFRIKDILGHYYWCRIRATTQYNNENQPIKAIGVIVDIDHEKKQKEILLDMAQRDALTGLYNKVTIDALVEQHMRNYDSSSKHALFILDVDNFKRVNDTYGHLAGDSLLSDVAMIIKEQLQDSTLIGRIGGDEFLIYFPEVFHEKEIHQKGYQLLKSLSHIIPEIGAAPISCSIGAVICQQGTHDYHELYQCADKALYAQKNKGRGSITFYHSELENQLLHIPVDNDVDAKLGTNRMVEGYLAQYTFRTLYAADDIQFALNSLLEIIGRSFDVSRIYIYEIENESQDNAYTFEWCPKKDNASETMSHISFQLICDQFTQEHIFYYTVDDNQHPDIQQFLQAQGIYSMLLLSMLDEGQCVGYIGFDECRSNHFWTNRQIAEFQLTANVLATFIVKLRQKQKLMKYQNGHQSIQ